MLSSLRSRLWLTYALLVGVVIAILGLALLVFLVRFPAGARQELERLRLIAALAVQRDVILDPSAQPGALARLETALQRADASLGVRFLILDAQGQVLFDSRPGATSGLPAATIPPAQRSQALPVYRDMRGRAWLYALRPLEDGSFLLVSAPRPQLNLRELLRDQFMAPFIRAAVVALALALLLAFLVARWVSAPLRRMSAAARSLADSRSLSGFQPVPLEGPREVQALGQAFNEMAARVQASQQSQRDFVANVSHDLKTPLTSIQGFAQAILDGTAETPQARRQAAEVIYSEAGRMHRMVLDLLDLARLDSGIAALRQDRLDLGELLHGLQTRLAPLAQQAGVELSVESAPLPPLVGDSDRLAQVFTNLLDNAIQHTPPGEQVSLRAFYTGGELQVQVVDHGPGIPPEELERIFERFYQTDKSRAGPQRGSGLGLAIARQIVAAHGGSISAFNNTLAKPVSPIDSTTAAVAQPQGSTFVVKLPVAKG